MRNPSRLLVVLLVVLSLVATTLGASAQTIDPGNGSTDVRVMNLNTNTADLPVVVTAEYINQSGGIDATLNQNVAPLGSYDFLASASGLTDGWQGSLIVSSVADVGALGTSTYTGGSATASVGSYRGFEAGAQAIYLPNLQQRPTQYSVITVQNTDSDTANVSIYYYARNGTAYASNPVTDSIPGGSQRSYDLSQKGVGKVPDLGVTTPPGDGWIGAVKIVSTNGKNLAGVATNFNIAYSTAYPSALAGANTLYFSAITRRYIAGSWVQFSGTIVQNLSDTTPANVQIYVTDRLGAAVFDFTDTIPALSAHGYNTRFQADTPAGQWAAFQAALGDDFNGAMYVTSNTSIVGLTDQQSLLTGFVGQFTYLGEASGGTNLFAPQVFRVSCVGNTCQKSTGVIVYNPDTTTSAAVTVRFIANSGSILYQFNDTIPARSRHGYNTRVQADTPVADFAPLKAALGDSFQGTVWVSSSLPVIGVAQHFVPDEGDAYNAYSK